MCNPNSLTWMYWFQVLIIFGTWAVVTGGVYAATSKGMIDSVDVLDGLPVAALLGISIALVANTIYLNIFIKRNQRSVMRAASPDLSVRNSPHTPIQYYSIYNDEFTRTHY